MESYAVFLRGINVGGKNVIKMDELTGLFVSLGYKNVKTLIQSGNVVFETTENNSDKIIKKTEAKLKEKLGNNVKAIIRTKKEIDEIIKLNPFGKKYENEDVKLYVCLLSAKPEAGIKLPLISPKKDMEIIMFKENCAFVLSRKLTRMYGFPNDFIENITGVNCTTRNWNTIEKIGNLLESNG